MTCHGFVLGVALAVLAALSACGGSSSETPPPLQPDPKGYHYAGPPTADRQSSDAGAEPVINDPDDDEKPRLPARSTWGVAAPRR